MFSKQAAINIKKNYLESGLIYKIQISILLFMINLSGLYRLLFIKPSPLVGILFGLSIFIVVATYHLWRPDRHITLAITANDLDKVRTLLNKHRWQATLTSFEGYTPLHWACNSSTDEVAAILLEYGANPNALSNENQTPIHWAVSKSSLIKLGYLIQHGANLDIQDDKGKTPLHWAVQFNSLPIVTFLIEYGADRNISDEDGKTPLELSRSKSEWEDVFNYLNNLESTQT
jgi:Ankyrin repeats (many copies)